ncbi:hypothetical protein OHB41_50375 [Streptomyces sp. NBC_01571]|uniref:hypothetical protein n=1 Tax=Streptomyces sp. NBC_01571 TaxID=2975883 RepID=UPI0022557382|nr:hypothetical protein [Streptomyces sp. NBC_01571]MCX4581169.1 hypothetical protein [Streptomyces sp. NBC_01571]
MTKSHGRKSRARNRSRRSGAAYAAANAGTLHVHASGPSAEDLQPADPSRWGVTAVPDLGIAAALIGASIERCAPCRQSLTAKLLEGDPIVLAVTADAAYRLHTPRVPDEDGPGTGPAQVFFFLARHARAPGGDARLLLAGVEQLPAADRRQLLNAVLDLFLAPVSTPLGQGQTTIASPPDESGAIRTGPHPLHQAHEPLQPSKENRIRMSETTEDVIQHAENAARSLAEFITELQYRGREIEYPAEASFIDRHLARAAGEMTTALTALRTFVEGLQERDRLMTDYRGVALDQVLQRYREASLAAELRAGLLRGSFPAVDRPVSQGASGEYRPVAAARSLAELVTGLTYRGLEYPQDAYRIYSYLTRVAGEMRTALTLLKTSAESLRDKEPREHETLGTSAQQYAGASVTAGQLASALNEAYSAIGHLAYKETQADQEPAPRN